MPVFKYICPVCQAPDSRLLTPAGARAPQRCRRTPECPGVLERNAQAPGVVNREVVDNGAMPKRVERDLDMQRLVDARNKTDYRNR